MAINFSKVEQTDTSIIKDIEGFTFISENKIEGFGFITKNPTAITVITIDKNKSAKASSIIINEYGIVNFYSTVEEFLKAYFGYNIESIKVYKQINDMNILVDF